MRKVLMLAALLITPAMAPAEAGDRGSRHFTPHAGARLHAPPPGRGFHDGHFAQHRHAAPRRFGHSGGGLALRFHGGRSGFGAIQRFNRPHFRPAHPHFRAPFHGGRVFRFRDTAHVDPWHLAPRHPTMWRGRSHGHW